MNFTLMPRLAMPVIYRPSETDEPVAAIITRVREDGTVDLHVFTPNAAAGGVERVSANRLAVP